jgi:protocatechuate 3,4-dioxygenase, beta subunit
MKHSSNPAIDGACHTPGLLLGPYYPLQVPMGADADLWRGDTLPVGARHLRFEGQVLTHEAAPVPNAHVELWQADQCGRYRHASAPEHTRVATDFVGYGSTCCDAQGRFVFRSLVPGTYADGDVMRAPHLHVQITGRFDRLVTQIFLPGDERNRWDRWYRAVANPERLLPQVVRDDASGLHLHWTVFIAQA